MCFLANPSSYFSVPLISMFGFSPFHCDVPLGRYYKSCIFAQSKKVAHFLLNGKYMWEKKLLFCLNRLMIAGLRIHFEANNRGAVFCLCQWNNTMWPTCLQKKLRWAKASHWLNIGPYTADCKIWIRGNYIFNFKYSVKNVQGYKNKKYIWAAI